MIARKRLWVILSCALAIGALVLLSAGLSQLELQPGHPLPRFREEPDTEIPALPGFLDSKVARYVILVTYVLALLLAPFTIAYLIISPAARRRMLRTLAIILCIAVFLLTLRNRPETLTQIEFQSPADLRPGAAAPLAEFVANPPQWAVLVTATAVAVLLAAGLVAMLWWIWQRARRPEGSLEQLAQRAEGAIAALQAGEDLRDAIIRCYFEMCRVLREQRGIWRDEAMTPREFERYLAREGLPEKQVAQLTRMFETVRYGAKATGKREELEAIDCLAAIVQACRGSA